MDSSRQSSYSRQLGFTLLEMVMAMTITSTVMVSFVLIYPTTMSQASDTHDQVDKAAKARRVLAEIEQGVRLSEEILSAGTDRLEFASRYFVDLDSDLECVLYTLSDGNLYKQVGEGTAFEANHQYPDAELVLENVSAFSSYSLEIADEFSRVDYGADAAVIAEGDVKTVNLDLLSQAKYKLAEYNLIDADLSRFYDADFEAIKIKNSGAANQSVTVAPELRKDGVRISAEFTPEQKGEDYHVIVYGDEIAALDYVAVVFKADHTVELISVSGGRQVDSVIYSDELWAPFETYNVTLEFIEDRAQAWIKHENKIAKIGKVPTDSDLDQKAVHILSKSPTGLADWSAIDIAYPFIDIQLDAMLDDSNVLQMDGGATRRSKN